MSLADFYLTASALFGLWGYIMGWAFTGGFIKSWYGRGWEDNLLWFFSAVLWPVFWLVWLGVQFVRLVFVVPALAVYRRMGGEL